MNPIEKAIPTPGSVVGNGWRLHIPLRPRRAGGATRPGSRGPAGQESRGQVRDLRLDSGEAGHPDAFKVAKKLGLEGLQVSLVPAGDSLYLVPLDLQKSYLLWAAGNSLAICSFAIGELNNVPLKSDPLAEKWLDQAIDIASSMQVRRILVPFFGKGDLRSTPRGRRRSSPA